MPADDEDSCHCSCCSEGECVQARLYEACSAYVAWFHVIGSASMALLKAMDGVDQKHGGGGEV